MRLFNAIARRIIQAANTEIAINSPQELEKFILGSMNGTASGVSVTPDKALRVSTVYACVRILSDAAAQLPLRIHRRADNQRVLESDHAVDRLLAVKPNHWQTPFEFKKLKFVSLLMRGNFYALKVVSVGRVIALFPMHPDKVEVTQLKDMSLAYVYTRSDGVKIPLAQDQVHHVRAMSMDGVRGLSPISYAAEEIGLALQTRNHGARTFRNNANPGGILQTDKGLSDEAIARLKTQFEERYSGTENAGKTLVIEEGLKWERISMTSEEAQFLETRKFERAEIAAFFGVPPHLVGDLEKTTSWGTGIEQQGIGFIVYALGPWLQNDQEAIARDLLTEKDIKAGRYARYNIKALLRGDFKTRQEGLSIQRRNGVISANEWRELEDMNPRSDPGGDEYIVEANMSEQDGAPPQKEPENEASPQAD